MEKGTEFKVLDHGFIRLVDWMGSDQDIVDAARISYGAGTRSNSDNQKLINYLMKNSHTSPFESCEIKLHIKLPIFVARQWVRHRTASLNEYSARYSILDNEYYLPSPSILGAQSQNNKQGREEGLSDSEILSYLDGVEEVSELAYKYYESFLNDKSSEYYNPNNNGVARELARIVLPVNYYTQWYWKIDLHNLLHFLKLRMDAHAQYEIREYATIIAEIIKELFPLTWAAFENYQLYSVTFSRNQWRHFHKMLERGDINIDNLYGLTKQELKEVEYEFFTPEDE